MVLEAGELATINSIHGILPQGDPAITCGAHSSGPRFVDFQRTRRAVSNEVRTRYLFSSFEGLPTFQNILQNHRRSRARVCHSPLPHWSNLDCLTLTFLDSNDREVRDRPFLAIRPDDASKTQGPGRAAMSALRREMLTVRHHH